MPPIEPKPHGSIRILSYNVHRCLGLDGVLSPSRTAEVIASVEPDIVALQELDVGRSRSGNVDQAQLIADELEMNVHFHPAMRVLEELYGDAVLTDLPVRLVRADALPLRRRSLFSEPRGAIWVAVRLRGHGASAHQHASCPRRQGTAPSDRRAPRPILDRASGLPRPAPARRRPQRGTDLAVVSTPRRIDARHTGAAGLSEQPAVPAARSRLLPRRYRGRGLSCPPQQAFAHRVRSPADHHRHPHGGRAHDGCRELVGGWRVPLPGRSEAQA